MTVGLELPATVRRVATREQAATPEDVSAKVYAWNDRKTRFTPRQIEIALGSLRSTGWVPAGVLAS